MRTQTPYSLLRKALEVAREQGAGALLSRLNRRLGIAPAHGAPTGRTCLRPYYYASIHLDGRVWCCCPGWVKFPLGKLTARTPLPVLWNNRIARTYRAAMHSTELDRVCQPDNCPYMIEQRLPRLENSRLIFDDVSSGIFPADVMSDPSVTQAAEGGAGRVDYLPRSLEIAADARCNLACATCRDHRISQIDKKTERLLELVRGTVEALGPELRHLHLLGSGEAFYSPFCLELLRGLERGRYPHLTVHILTNGQMLTPRLWDGLGGGAAFIREISVSVDAASKDTYERARLGAHWDKLLVNMDFLRSLRAGGAVDKTSINFVVTADNFREMPAFVRLGQSFAMDEIVFTTVQPWYGMGADYRAAAAHLPGHPEHAALQAVLRDPAFDAPEVLLGLNR